MATEANFIIFYLLFFHHLCSIEISVRWREVKKIFNVLSHTIRKVFKCAAVNNKAVGEDDDKQLQDKAKICVKH